MAVQTVRMVGYVPPVASFYEGSVRYRVCPAASKAHAVERVNLVVRRLRSSSTRPTHPLSSTNSAIHARSRRRNSLLPSSDPGSTSWKPSRARAVLGSMQSALETLVGGSALCESSGSSVLCSDRSIDMVAAMDTYQQVSSSALCFPGNIHGTLIMKASTISTDRHRVAITRFASALQWLERRRDRAPAEGMKSAVMAAIEVKRNKERALVKDGVYSRGSRPQRVCDRLWWKLHTDLVSRLVVTRDEGEPTMQIGHRPLLRT